MRPIPKKLREELAADPYMARCIYDGCPGKPEWEHCWIYQGRQINERFAIQPVCYDHHRGKLLDKRYNEFKSLERATKEELAKYPKKDWEQLKKYLDNNYGTKKESGGREAS